MAPTPRTTSLQDWFGHADAERIRTSLRAEPFRRLTHAPEQAIAVDRLCQMIHVDLDASARRQVLGEDGAAYFVNDLNSALREIDDLLHLGIPRIYLQAVPSGAYANGHALLERMAATLAAVQHRFGATALDIVMDPQALCMGNDLRWGVRHADDTVDAERTLLLLGEAIETFARMDTFAVMTIGRINCEVEVARTALRRVAGSTRLYAFSTNSETPTAYFERTAGDPRRAVTGQKLLVGNAVEMVLRTLIDVDEGTDGMLQKPIENVHVIGALAGMIHGRVSVAEFMNRWEVTQLLEFNAHLADRCGGADFASRTASSIRHLRLGAYEVSGTYSLRCLLSRKFGPALAWAVAQETYLTALGAGGGAMEFIVGRGMCEFVRTGRDLELL